MTTLAPARPALSPLPLLIIGQLLVAAAPILVRLTGQPPLDSAFGRMITAVPLLMLWTLLQPPPPSPLRWRGRDRLVAGLAGAAFALDLAGVHLSIALGSVTNATFLTNLAPVLLVLAVWFLQGEKPGNRQSLGLAVAVLGTMALAADTLGRAGADPLADAAGLGSAVAFALYLLLVRTLRMRFASGPVMLWTSLAAALTLLPLALLDGTFSLPETAGGLAAMLALGALVHATGQGLTAAALGKLPAATVGPLLLLQPVLTALAVPLVLGETLGLWQMAGAALILVSISLSRP